MKALSSDARTRPILLGALGVFVLLGLAAGPVGEAIEASAQIAVARDRLARARDAGARTAPSAPLATQDADSLLAAFRGRLDALADGRAVLVEQTGLDADPGQPNLPRLRVSLRGTADGLHGLLQALETEAPSVIAQEAEIGVVRAADAETGRPTVMRASLTARGVLLAAPTPAQAEGTP